MSASYVQAEIKRANIAWEQACIRIMQVGSTMFVDAPKGTQGKAKGKDILEDGKFTYFPDSPADEIAVISKYAPEAAVDLVEVFFVAPIPDADGLTYGPYIRTEDSLPFKNMPEMGENTFIFIDSGLYLQGRTMAHEIGHALQNRDDSSAPQYIFYPSESSYFDDLPNFYRRITASTEIDCRTLRVGGLGGVGNRILKP